LDDSNIILRVKFKSKPTCKMGFVIFLYFKFILSLIMGILNLYQTWNVIVKKVPSKWARLTKSSNIQWERDNPGTKYQLLTRPWWWWYVVV